MSAPADSRWLRCYRCWSQNLEVQVHYEGIHRIDPSTGERAEVVDELQEEGVDVPVVVGGIIPKADAERLREGGVAGVYTPKDFDINRIIGEIVGLVAQRTGAAAPQPA